MQPQVPTVTVAELVDGSVLIDVREDYEWAEGRVEGSVHVPMNQIPQHLHYQPEVFASELPVVIMCAHGHRSAHVAAWLLHNGVDAVSLDGGLSAWMSAGRPITRG